MHNSEKGFEHGRVPASGTRRRSQRWAGWALGFTALLATNGLTLTGAQEFADPALTKCVATAINKESVSSVQELKKLSCNAAGIKDSAGLGRLTSLESLSLFGNQLTTIDLSKLDKLKLLNVANNRLKEVDLSNGVELETLYLFGNRLEALSLESTPKLVKLKAEKNRLLEVTFGQMAALEKVYLFNNEMEDIKIDSLPALRFLDVRSNPMPDEVYDYLDAFEGIKSSHDGNTEDWK